MKISKKVERTRKVVIDVEVNEAVFQASVADHFNSEEPREVFAGDDVRVQQMSKDGTTRNGLTFPIKAWPAVREAIDRAISEFKAAYPESPQ